MRAVRWAVVVAAVSLVVAAVAVAYAAGKAKARPLVEAVPVPVADVVRARRFQLVDRRGRLRAELGPAGPASEWMGLRIYAEDGREVASLQVRPGGGGSLALHEHRGGAG